MTDQQFQPGQTNPPVQGGWVFGGNPEEIIHDPSMFGPLEQVEVKPAQEAEDNNTSPFDWFVIPQNDTKTDEVVEEKDSVEPVIENVAKEAVVDTTEETEEKIPVVQSIVEESTEEPIEKTDEDKSIEDLSDIQQKFYNLSKNIIDLNSLLRLKEGEVIEIVWSNNEKFSVFYQFGINDQKEINIKRIETNKEEDESNFNELKLSINSDSNLFEIFLDDVLLFEESELLEDNRKRSQVIEKINKFIFLTESKLKDVQKELKAKQEEEEERRRLQDIFRNF